ncbi:hypothetical protein ACFL3O_00170 [Candidatus Neomarinimicrobiota bacterium]
MKKLLVISLLLFITCTLLFAQEIRNISDVGPKTEVLNKSVYSHIYYVAHHVGSNDNGDGSKQKPWKSITFALKKVNDQSDNNKVAFIVGAGTYTGSTIIMEQYIDLYGGFNCKTWDRDIYKYSSILDGENARRVVVGANNSRIDGFTIANGLSRSHGGGVLCDDTSPVISNCFISNNYILEPPEFNHNRIHQDANHGAGIACFFNAVPEIRNNVFYGNRTSIGNGAGIAFYGWLRMDGAPSTKINNNIMEGGLQPIVKNNVFVNNVSGVNDVNRTRSSNGAAISCAFESRPLIENNVIAANQAKGRSDAGGIYSEYFSYPIIIGNWIVGNISDDDGGGIYTMKLGHASIINNFIAGNWTIGNGVGGIRISKEGRADIIDNIIVQNQTGGAVDCVDGYMRLKNNLIMHNKGGSSIRYYNHFNYFNSSIVEDNIIRENENNMIIDTFGGQDVIFQSNNVDEDISGEDNVNDIIVIKNDNEEIKIENISFNKKLFQSVVEIENVELNKSLSGRVVRINDFWSVIANVEGNKIYIWGNATANIVNNSKLIIIPSYAIN